MTSTSVEICLLCFQHCEKRNIFCLCVPDVCPLCRRSTDATESRIPPFRVPLPFTDASDASCSIVVKPTHGSFIRDFSAADNLHIGITNTKGCVYDFDEDGIHIGASSWTECFAIPLLKSGRRHDQNSWDKKLDQFASAWSERYSEVGTNCYTFVLKSLKYLGLDKEYPCINNRVDFCQEMIIPVSKRAGKYLTLYRKVVDNHIVVQEEDLGWT